ncbi:hypothetical protein [Nitratireductor pacificus]|uniref:COG3904 family protein n=1 Tax=Nitratireductor pacificus TaxID=1231180 RepID=UPI00178C7B5E|nr:hypothetical protein [Nitratireductor pacificus]
MSVFLERAKKQLVSAGLLLLALLAGSIGAWANTERVDQYGPFFFIHDQPDMLIYSGQVGANDLLNLKKALREHPTIRTLILKDNPGGLVHIGLVIAEEVYERGLDTYIPKDSFCASACSFVFFAGKNRLAQGRLGVHQISAPEMSGAQAQFGVSDIVATLPKYGVAADVLGIMFRTPPDDMYFFSPHEITKYGINRTGQTYAARAEPGPAPTPAPPPLEAPSGGNRPERQARAAPSAPEQPASQPQRVSDEQRAVNAAVLIIQAGSASADKAMEFTREFYADQVEYFKRNVSKAEILDDKRAYFSRWTKREFRVHEDSLHAKCQNTICAVIGTYDYVVASPERGKETSGTAEFSYILDFSERLKIVHEDGQVVRR